MTEEIELSIAEIHQIFVDALDSLNCGAVGRDKDGTIVYVNARLLAWLGYDERELIGQSALAMSVPELKETMIEEFKRTAEGDGRARLSMLQRKDSSTFPVLIIPQLRKANDGDRPYLSIIVDLGTVHTARSAGMSMQDGLRPRLERIALELNSIGLSAELPGAVVVPLDHPELSTLSEREREVLAHLMQGERVPAISESLHISPHTVRNHLKSIYRQVGVGSQSELIKHVRGLIPAE